MATLIRERAVVADDWQRLDDGAAPPADGACIVAPDQLDDLPAGVRRGVHISNTADVEALELPLETIELVELEFPTVADGRAYSQARLLRDRLDYRGRLRATGAVTLDALWEMARCGFDEFALRADQDADACLRAFDTFSTVYQPGADARTTVRRLRREAPGPA